MPPAADPGGVIKYWATILRTPQPTWAIVQTELLSDGSGDDNPRAGQRHIITAWARAGERSCLLSLSDRA